MLYNWRCWKSSLLWNFNFKFHMHVDGGHRQKPIDFQRCHFQYGRQAAILKVTSLKINRLLPMATINMHMKFEIEIPKQTWLRLRKPCRLQTDGRTDRRTRWIQYTPPPTSLGGGIMKNSYTNRGRNSDICNFLREVKTRHDPKNWGSKQRSMTTVTFI